MSLTSALTMSGQDTAAYLAVRANNAAEMQQKLELAIAAIDPDLRIWDLQVVGCGAAPNFLALLTIASAEGAGIMSTPSAFPPDLSVAVATAVDPVELGESMEAALDAAAGQTFWKVVNSGGGFGPNWMAITLYNTP